MGLRNRLTSTALRRLAAKPGRHSDGGNLYLNVSTAGSRRWVFLFRWRGKPTEMGLGRFDDVSLAAARERARSAREILASGRSPLAIKREQCARPLFGAVADDLIESLKPSWKNPKHAAQWEMTLSVYAAPLRKLMVDEIETDDVLKVLRPIWALKPETASRTRMRIERTLDAARASGFRTGENPARWKGHLDVLLPARTKLSRGHHAAMPYRVIPAFITKLKGNSSISNLALEFTVLTAARSGEVRGAVWDEINRLEALWTVPADRMKEKREHVVPLVPRALEIIEQAEHVAGKRRSGFVFPGMKHDAPLSDASLSAALERAGGTAYTVHGFRSSFRDWCGDETDFAREIAEAALSHAIGDASERSYRRGTAVEKRRLLMAAWADYIGRG